jgi:hypothetical protein
LPLFAIRSATGTSDDVSGGAAILFDAAATPLIASPSAFADPSPPVELFRRFDRTAVAVDFVVDFAVTSVVVVDVVIVVASVRIVASSAIQFRRQHTSPRFIGDDFIQQQQFADDGRFIVRRKRRNWFSRQRIFIFFVADVDVSSLFVDHRQLQQRRIFLLPSTQWHPFPR